MESREKEKAERPKAFPDSDSDGSPPPTPKLLAKTRGRTSTQFLQKSLQEMDHVNVNSNSWINDDELEYTKKLGSGAGGKVWMGLYKGKEVAIKVLKALDDDEHLAEFKKEFQIMRSV